VAHKEKTWLNGSAPDCAEAVPGASPAPSRPRQILSVSRVDYRLERHSAMHGFASERRQMCQKTKS
jgi:hypothetical protein